MRPDLTRLARGAAVAALFMLPSLLLIRSVPASEDELEVFLQFKSLYHHHTLNLDAYAEVPPTGGPLAYEDVLPLGRRRIGPSGHYYSLYGVGYAAIVAGSTALLDALTFGAFDAEPLLFKWLNAGAFFLTGWLMWWLLHRIGVGPAWSGVVVFGYLFSTYATYAAAWWASNLVVCSLTFTAYVCLAIATGRLTPDARGAARPGFLVLCGALLGLAGLTRGFAFLLAPAYALALWASCALREREERGSRSGWVALLGVPLRHWVDSLRFLAPIAICVAVYLAVLVAKLGGFQGTYEEAEVGFTTPFWIGFLGSLLWPAKSFLFLTPVSLIAAGGLWRLIRLDRIMGGLACFTIGLYVIAYSQWWAWWSGPDIGQRFWLPIVPLLVFPLALLRSRVARAVVIALVAFGTFTQWSIHPWFPRQLYRAVYHGFPHPEGVDAVATGIEEDLSMVVRTTFWDMALLRAALARDRRSHDLPPLRGAVRGDANDEP